MNTTTQCAQSPKPKCDNELSKLEDKIQQWATTGLRYFPLKPWVLRKAKDFLFSWATMASQEKEFFMELIIQSTNKPLMAQNYRSICNNIQCAVHGRSKRRKKNVMVCKFVFGRVRKGAKGDYKLRHVCLSVCMTVRPSGRPHGIIRLALDEFS